MKQVFLIAMLAVMLLLQGLPLDAQRGSDFQVIVNASNSVDQLTRDQISQMFLKKTQEWENGVVVVPVDLKAGAAVREKFSQVIHGRSVASVKSYWQQQIFSGREVPPPEKADDDEVIDFVSGNMGAIGYVRASTSVSGPVKALTIVD